jgi:hypothetical protein
MTTTGAFWRKKVVVAVQFLLLSGSGPAFAGSDSLGCFEPKPSSDGDGDVSIEGDTRDGSVHAGVSPDEFKSEFLKWLFSDDPNAQPPGGWPPGTGGLSGTGGTGGTTGTAGTTGTGGTSGTGGTDGTAGTTGTAGATGTGGTTGSGGSGGNCSSSSGQCPALPSCEDIRSTVFARPAESVTRARYVLNITFPQIDGFVLTAVESSVPIPVPADTEASLFLVGNWAIPPGHYPTIDGRLSVPIVRMRR